MYRHDPRFRKLVNSTGRNWSAKVPLREFRIPDTRAIVLSFYHSRRKRRMYQPLSVKTVVVPKGQNPHGVDVVRFTADYAATGLYEQCIGCYPPAHNDLKTDSLIVCESDDSEDSTREDQDSLSCNVSPTWTGVVRHSAACSNRTSQPVDLRKASDALQCGGRPKCQFYDQGW